MTVDSSQSVIAVCTDAGALVKLKTGKRLDLRCRHRLKQSSDLLYGIYSSPQLLSRIRILLVMSHNRSLKSEVQHRAR